MASYPVTVYRWDDPGAPQIGNGRASDIINIWQKCLVEGYGTKLPLGWTRPYYDAARQRACYRNNVDAGGSGGYAIVFSNAGNDADYNLMRLSHAKSMSDIDTAVGQGFTKAFQVINASGNLRRTKWVIIGTGCAFYFMVSYDNFQMNGSTNTGLPSMFVGDFFSRIPNDAGRFIAECSPGANSDISSANSLTLDIMSQYIQFIGSPQNLKIFSTDNSDAFQQYSISFHSNTFANNTDITIEPSTPQILTPISISINSIYGGSGVPSQASINNLQNPPYRGQLPGVYLAMNPYRGNRAYPTVINHNNENHWLMRSFSTSPAVLINMEVWNDPFV